VSATEVGRMIHAIVVNQKVFAQHFTVRNENSYSKDNGACDQEWAQESPRYDEARVIITGYSGYSH
jgi:hypothetical protein